MYGLFWATNDAQLLFDAQLLIHAQSLTDGRFQFAMEISWDGVLPTPEQWESLQGRAFECMEDIKGAQSAISTRALLELLRRLGQPQASSANLTKPQMAALIVGVLISHEGWSASELGNVHLASLGRDSVDLSSLTFGLELASDSPKSVLSSRRHHPSSCKCA